MHCTKELKKCSHPSKDCASLHEEYCLALEDTNFVGKTCPFYMNKETRSRRIAECQARLDELANETEATLPLFLSKNFNYDKKKSV